MIRCACVLLLALAGGGQLGAAAGADDVVFRTDVSLVRVDAQVVDRDNRAITGLRATDFVLREEGRPQKISNFASEDMPVDVVLLLDVSTSMRPHVQRIASASHQALRVLGDQDRVAIMVFDRTTRLRLPFRNSRADVERELESLLRQESFNGGTDITRGLLDAADYVARQARRDARRAIVIVTDDQTERDRDVAGVSRALTRADAVLSALIAPDAMQNRSRSPGMGRGGPGGGSWPGGGIGGPLGGIILGRRGPYGGRGPGPGPGSGGWGTRTQSAGTAEIARESGGDSLPVKDASAFEDTLARIRQRYALHFHLPEGVKPGEERGIQVELADAAGQRYPGAGVRYRRVYLAPSGRVEPTVITRAPLDASGGSAQSAADMGGPSLKRRQAVNQPEGPTAGPLRGPASAAAAGTQPAAAPAPQGGWQRVDQPAAKPSPSDPGTPSQQPSQGGWPRVKPGEQP
jgi:VWFA-related protein